MQESLSEQPAEVRLGEVRKEQGGTNMTDREQLTALLMASAGDFISKNGALNCTKLADYLLEHGVIVPPCKVGDTVYSIEMRIVDKRVKYKVCEVPFSLTLWENGWEDIFLTREEAERALKEREDNA